jgi:hypothetical protein
MSPRRSAFALALLVAASTASSGLSSAQQPAPPTGSPRDAALLAWTADNDAGDCGEECWGGYSLWASPPKTSVFRRVVRQFSLTPPEIFVTSAALP